MDKTYKYNAFISYRHNDLDKFVAENLHKLIETYKMPESVIKKYNITDNNFRRVFRDQDELQLSSSLEDPIVEALRESQFLIVICSPRLKESKWCKKEIENFIKLHGRNKILCVLVEGEPQDSFPEILQYQEEKVLTKTGKERNKKVPCEPLAMDVRGKDKKEIYHNLKKELIRVIAPMYNLDYDDIKRRHEEREQKRKSNILKGITFASLAFAIYSFVLFSRIYLSNKQLKYDQAISLVDDAAALYNKDNRSGAILKAYQSLTEYNGNKMPITADGIYTLTRSLGLYNVKESTYSAISQLDTNSVLRKVITDNDGKYLLTFDNSRELILWNLEQEKKVKTINNIEEREATFLGEKGFAYITDVDVLNTRIIVNDFNGKTVKEIDGKDYECSLNASKNGKYLEVYCFDKIDIYETTNYSKVSTYKVPKGMKILFDDNHHFDEKEENLVFTIANDDYDYQKKSGITLVTYNIKNNKIISNPKFDVSVIEKIILVDSNAIVLSHKYISEYMYDMKVINYNFKSGKINYQKLYKGKIPNDIETTISDDKDDRTILISSGENVWTLDYKTGKTKLEEIAVGDVIYIRPYSGTYLAFTIDGDVVWIKNSDTTHSWITNLGKAGYFNLHLKNYSGFLYTSIGYLGYSTSENRIIIYNKIKNDDYKKIEYTPREFKDINYVEKNSLKEKYNIQNKGLVSYMFYSDDEKILFVSYQHGILEIYDTETKELLKSLKNMNSLINSFVAKTDDDEYIIKSYNSLGYVLNKDFELITYINELCDYQDGKYIISLGKDYYEVPKYTQEEIIAKGYEYLTAKNMLE